MILHCLLGSACIIQYSTVERLYTRQIDRNSKLELNILETLKLIRNEIVSSGTGADITSKKRSKMFFHFFCSALFQLFKQGLTLKITNGSCMYQHN